MLVYCTDHPIVTISGVFVSKVSESSFEHVLQSGDEILEVDGCAISEF